MWMIVSMLARYNLFYPIVQNNPLLRLQLVSKLGTINPLKPWVHAIVKLEHWADFPLPIIIGHAC